MKNPRERLFAVIVGCVAVMLVGYFVYSWIAGQFRQRATAIANLNKDIKYRERIANRGRAAARRVRARPTRRSI